MIHIVLPEQIAVGRDNTLSRPTLDIFHDTALSLSYESPIYLGGDESRINTIRGTVAYSFDIPNTARNQRLLRFAEVWGNTGAFPKNIRAEIMVDGIPLFAGYLSVKGCTQKVYSVAIAINSVSALRDTDAQKLALGTLQVPISNIDDFLNHATQTAYNPLQYDYIFYPTFNPDFFGAGLGSDAKAHGFQNYWHWKNIDNELNYGFNMIQSDAYFTPFTPHLRIEALFKRLFQSYDLRIVGDFFNDTELKLLTWHNNQSINQGNAVSPADIAAYNFARMLPNTWKANELFRHLSRRLGCVVTMDAFEKEISFSTFRAIRNGNVVHDWTPYYIAPNDTKLRTIGTTNEDADGNVTLTDVITDYRDAYFPSAIPENIYDFVAPLVVATAQSNSATEGVARTSANVPYYYKTVDTTPARVVKKWVNIGTPTTSPYTSPNALPPKDPPQTTYMSPFNQGLMTRLQWEYVDQFSNTTTGRNTTEITMPQVAQQGVTPLMRAQSTDQDIDNVPVLLFYRGFHYRNTQLEIDPYPLATAELSGFQAEPIPIQTIVTDNMGHHTLTSSTPTQYSTDWRTADSPFERNMKANFAFIHPNRKMLENAQFIVPIATFKRFRYKDKISLNGYEFIVQKMQLQITHKSHAVQINATLIMNNELGTD